MNDYKLNDIEIKIPDKIADDIILQTENNMADAEDESNECIVITVNDYDVW